MYETKFYLFYLCMKQKNDKVRFTTNIVIYGWTNLYNYDRYAVLMSNTTNISFEFLSLNPNFKVYYHVPEIPCRSTDTFRIMPGLEL